MPSRSIPPRWLVNWCALNDMDVIDATTHQRRGDWYVFSGHPGARHGFYVRKSATRKIFMASYAARNPHENFYGSVGRTRTIGDQVANHGKNWSAPKLV